MNKKLLTTLLAISLFLSTPSIIRIPRVFPFIHAEVRSAAPKAIEQLRSQGLWLSNAELEGIQITDAGICFEWLHRYRRPQGLEKREYITTCINDAS